MKRSSRYLCPFAAVALALSAPSRAFAAATPPAAQTPQSVDTPQPVDTPASVQAKARLAAIRGRIAELTARLGAELKARDSLNARLREADLHITATRRRLEDLHGAQHDAERRRGGLRADEARGRQALEAQRAALAAVVRSAYVIGRQEQLKLLLNQNDPASVGRMLAFDGYFARERGARIGAIRAQVAHLQDLTAAIDRTTAKLQALQIDTGREMSGLQRARAERAAALAAVTLELSGGADALAQLKRQEQAEELLVADLARVLQDFPVDTQQSFSGLRGKLAWPVPGRLTARSGAVRASGVLIDAARGAKVRAPYYGRVVYADWLQGLGLLLIIGHSGNFMTLYGHAEVLYKSVGDWVAPGDVIAALGDSSGAAPQLYFEIRDGRKAVDPKLWLQAAP